MRFHPISKVWRKRGLRRQVLLLLHPCRLRVPAAVAAPPPPPPPIPAPALHAPPPVPRRHRFRNRLKEPREKADGATRRVGAEAPGTKNHPVVGWLVCLAGPDRGRDFRLHAEKNFVGRSPIMDVCIAGDETVSRDRHALVIFDPKKQTFWALPGDASGLVYLNGDMVNVPTQMKRDDILEVGHTKLTLIPFCGEKYTWTTDFPTTVEMETPGTAGLITSP